MCGGKRQSRSEALSKLRTLVNVIDVEMRYKAVCLRRVHVRGREWVRIWI